jgi:hypothetical protein
VWDNSVINIGGTKGEEIFPTALGQIFLVRPFAAV